MVAAALFALWVYLRMARMRRKHPWPGNLNPACLPTRRCGGCRRDRMGVLAKQGWASGKLLRAVRSRDNRWSIEEDDVLRMGNGKRFGVLLAALPGRSMRAIEARASTLGVHLTNGGYSAQHIADALGINEGVVLRWIARGILPATRWGERARTDVVRLRRWVISHEDVARFLRAYPWLYEPGGVRRDHVLYPIVQAAHRGEVWLNAKQLAQKLGSDDHRIADLAREGVLAYERDGRRWFFRASLLPEFRAALEERRARRIAHLDTRSSLGRWVA